MAKPELGIVTPLPPLPSGVADYALEQARALEAHWSITFLVADEQPDPSPFLDFPAQIERWSRFEKSASVGKMPLLHHMGNNPQHAYVVDALKACGGIVLLHELGLHNLMAWKTLGRGDEAGYARLLQGEVGDLAPPLARAGALGLRSALAYALTPLCGPVTDAADGIIVHSEYAARELARRGFGKAIRIVPHFFAPPPEFAATAPPPAPADELVFGSLGFMTDAKLTFLVIEMLGRLKVKLPPFRYRLVGEAGDRAALMAAIDKAGLTARVDITGYVGAAEFWAHLSACDIVFSLRYPSGGETSGTLVRALGLGKTAIAFDYGPFADFADEALVKVPLDTENLAALEAAVLALAHDPARRAAIGRAAIADTTAHRSPRACAEQVSDFITTLMRGAA